MIALAMVLLVVLPILAAGIWLGMRPGAGAGTVLAARAAEADEKARRRKLEELVQRAPWPRAQQRSLGVAFPTR